MKGLFTKQVYIRLDEEGGLYCTVKYGRISMGTRQMHPFGERECPPGEELPVRTSPAIGKLVKRNQRE